MADNRPTRKQQFVPVQFLRGWCDKSGMLHCRRFGGACFPAKPENIAFQRDLYRWPRITLEESRAIVQIATNQKNPQLRELDRALLWTYAYTSKIRSMLKPNTDDGTADNIWRIGHQTSVLDENDDIQMLDLVFRLTGEHSASALQGKMTRCHIEGSESFMSAVEHHFWPVLAKLRSSSYDELTENEILMTMHSVCNRKLRKNSF